MKWNIGDIFGAAILTCVFTFLALLFFVYLPAQLRADRACLRAGWPEASVTWRLEVYCTRTVTGDVRSLAVPLDSVR